MFIYLRLAEKQPVRSANPCRLHEHAPYSSQLHNEAYRGITLADPDAALCVVSVRGAIRCPMLNSYRANYATYDSTPIAYLHLVHGFRHLRGCQRGRPLSRYKLIELDRGRRIQYPPASGRMPDRHHASSCATVPSYSQKVSPTDKRRGTNQILLQGAINRRVRPLRGTRHGTGAACERS